MFALCFKMLIKAVEMNNGLFINFSREFYSEDCSKVREYKKIEQFLRKENGNDTYKKTV